MEGHRKTGIHPFERNYLKVLTVGLATVAVMTIAGIDEGIIASIIVTLIAYALYPMTILLPRTVERRHRSH